MFFKIFRTKERKVIGAVLGSIILIILIIVIKNIAAGELFVEKAVMAENYLEAGDYEKAVEAYKEALSVKDSDMELLSIGLADSYIGLNDYDKALEILNSCYQKASGEIIKKKIEEVMSAKTDYEYLQSISRAEVYYTNKEYEKAISEFEKAKLIDSKKITAYQRIAESYIELNKYDLAKEEVLEGKEITQDKALDETLALVDSYLLKDQYDSVVAQAEEYICQENYKDGLKTYQEAINLLPKVSAAYLGLTEAYISMDDYEDAILLLQEAVEITNSSEIRNKLSELTRYKEDNEKRKKLLSELYNAMKTRDFSSVCAVLDQDFFKENVVSDLPVYYGADKDKASIATGMIIYDSSKIYQGEIRNGERDGNGLYLVLPEGDEEEGYYYYEGKWGQDVPKGIGKTVELLVLQNEAGKAYESKTVTEGYFSNGAESGFMIKYFYEDDKETGRLTYYAIDGVPMPDNYLEDPSSIQQQQSPYTIGKLYLDGKLTGKEYQVEPGTHWGVKN